MFWFVSFRVTSWIAFNSRTKGTIHEITRTRHEIADQRIDFSGKSGLIDIIVNSYFVSSIKHIPLLEPAIFRIIRPSSQEKNRGDTLSAGLRPRFA